MLRHREEYTLSQYALNNKNYAPLLTDRSCWPVGYDMIMHILVNNLGKCDACTYIRAHYKQLYAAYTAPTLNHIRAIPKDLQNIIKRYLIQVNVTNMYHAEILGQSITCSNGPYRLEYVSRYGDAPIVTRAYWEKLTVAGTDYGEIEYFEPNRIEFRTIWQSMCGPPPDYLPIILPVGLRKREYPQLQPALDEMMRGIREFKELLQNMQSGLYEFEIAEET